MSACPVIGCEFELDSDVPMLGQMILVYPDMLRFDGPTLRGATFFCPECAHALLNSVTPEEFLDRRFGDPAPETTEEAPR